MDEPVVLFGNNGHSAVRLGTHGGCNDTCKLQSANGSAVILLVSIKHAPLGLSEITIHNSIQFLFGEQTAREAVRLTNADIFFKTIVIPL